MVIAMYFAKGLFNRNISQLSHIDICQVIPNKANTVINIFWNISNKYLATKKIVKGVNDFEKKFNEEKEKFQSSLDKQANYISGKIAQLLRLRYGPQIRFYFD